MSDPALALQGAIIDAIKALATEADQNVFDTVPSRDPFPRVTVGEGQTAPIDADCYDGSESTIDVSVWSREVGFPQAKRIASAIRTRLHNGELVLPGHTLEILKVENTFYERDRDGLTSRARMQIRAVTQPSD